MATMASSEGIDGMMVVSLAVYAVPNELRCTLAATIIRNEVCPASGPSSPRDISDWSSHSATELTLSRSTRVGLQRMLLPSE